MTMAYDVPQGVTLTEYRDRVAAEIEARLSILDALDGDPDLEDGGDDEPTGDEAEPSLGSSPATSQDRWAQTPWPTCLPGYVDLEDDDEREDDDPAEEHDEGEEDGSLEPSLGAREHATNQAHAWANPFEAQYDDEDDPAESGIGDEGGLAEQIGAAL